MRPVLHAGCSRAKIRRAVQSACQVVRERDFKLLGTTMLDLSPRGMLLATDAEVLTGEELVVTFKSPRSERWYDCSATVARVLHGRRRGDRARALGIAFESLDLWSEMTLCHQLRGLLPILPRMTLLDGVIVTARRQ
jgi:hypothetical protein